MIQRWRIITTVCVVLSLVSCGGGGGGSSNACDKAGDISVELKCPGLTGRQAVVDKCNQEAASVPEKCWSKRDTANACAVKQPASNFECSSDNDGTNNLKDGVCTAEGEALIACLLGG